MRKGLYASYDAAACLPGGMRVLRQDVSMSARRAPGPGRSPRGGILRTRTTVRLVPEDKMRFEAMATAAQLRARGISTEVAPSADRFGKQIRYADRRGIPFVWFATGEVKDIRSGAQVAADPASWLPPEADLRPCVVRSSLA